MRFQTANFRYVNVEQTENNRIILGEKSKKG